MICILRAPGREAAPAPVKQRGALAVSSLQFGHTIMSREATIPVRKAFAAAVSNIAPGERLLGYLRRAK